MGLSLNIVDRATGRTLAGWDGSRWAGDRELAQALDTFDCESVACEAGWYQVRPRDIGDVRAWVRAYSWGDATDNRERLERLCDALAADPGLVIEVSC